MLLTSGYSGTWALIKLILVFVFILILAYYGTRFVGNYQNNVLNSKSNIRIIESCRIGGNKLLAIAKIGEDYYAIGVGKDEFTLIDKLDASYFDALQQEREAGKSSKVSNNSGLSFKDILKMAKSGKTDAEPGEDNNKDN
jgi:flagellar protein FliO/FliZ